MFKILSVLMSVIAKRIFLYTSVIIKVHSLNPEIIRRKKMTLHLNIIDNNQHMFGNGLG